MSTKKDTELFAIRRLEVSQIGPFAQLNMTFPDKPTRDNKAEIHILTGENGTGKSTALMLLSHCIPHDNLSIRKRQWTPYVNLSNYVIHFSDGYKGIYDFRHLRSLVSKKVSKNTSSSPNLRHKIFDTIGSPTVLDYLSMSDLDEYRIAFFAYSGYRKLSDSTVKSIADLTSSPFENALDFDKSTDTKTFVNWLASTITRSALAMAKGNLRDDIQDHIRATIYKLPILKLEQIVSDITGQQIQFELQESPLVILIHVDGQPLEFDQLPDGLKSIVSWLGDLIMRLDRIHWKQQVPLTERNFVLFLDEIEIHLHPAWQRKILPVVQQLFPNAQIFISTHSPFVVGSVDGAWVHRFEKDAQGHSRLQGEPILSEDSNSYEYILSEIFGVTERFGVEVERDLQEFKTIKSQILRNEANFNNAHFEQLIGKLMSQSTEIQSIIGMELRQLSRLTNRTFA